MNRAVAQPVRRTPRLWRRVTIAARRANIYLLLEIVAAIAFLAMAGATWLAFARAPPDGQLLPSAQVAVLLIGALIPAMALLVLLGRRLALRRAAGSTARLHVRLVFFFSLIAAVPTLLVAGFAAFLFQSGVDFWFSENARTLMRNANGLAQDYYTQNQLEVGDQTLTMAGDLRTFITDLQQRGEVDLASERFVDFVTFQMQGRELNETVILQAQPDGSLRTAAAYNLTAGNEPSRLAPAALPALRNGEPVFVTGNPTRIEAVAAVDEDSGVYLYNARNAEAASFQQWERARDISTAYDVLTSRSRALQLRFNAALFLVSLLLVGMAVWFALRFADRQVEPLTDLVAAARKVGAGNFALRVEGRTGADEIGLLNRAFNRMTAQLERQTAALLAANRQLEERRNFIEAVIESVTAGVLFIDSAREVRLMNSSAKRLLLEDGDAASAGPAALRLQDIAPQIDVMVLAGLASGTVSVARRGELRTLAVKLAAEGAGHVITFEDITRQLLDQRQAAWSDVARRIAHEIKNPLTPIQLATERLARRYRKQIDTDAELFDDLTRTIIRQVGELRKMVDEFSSFARLPKPNFRQEDALELVRQALFLQEIATPAIDFQLTAPDRQSLRLSCDRHQLGQAVTNILKNAVEAVEARAAVEEPDYRGRIEITLEADDDSIVVDVADNGVGLPGDRVRIAEPYVTTREKGTGLGLAIVQKIVEEHGGDMSFAANEAGGARITLRFARNPMQTNDREAA